MRIGIDASNLRSGGGITHIAELLAHCEPSKHGIEKVMVWAPASAMARIPPRPWLERIAVPALERMLPRRVAWQLFERSRLAAAACDIVFAPGATPAGRFRPFVSMSTNMLPFVSRELRRYGWSADWIRMLLLGRQQTKTFHDSDAVIFLTDHARDHISSTTGLPADTQVLVIPSGVNARFVAEPRVARPLEACSAADPLRFLYVSDLHPYKHHANVVDAVAALHGEGLPVALDIIGHPMNGPAADRLHHALARTAHTGAIRYLGPVDHESLPPVYREADAFVFASTCENLPMTLVEAMASGLPIAASNTRPMPDILDDSAVLFDAESVPSIADALRSLALDAALRDRLAQRGHERALQYSWVDCADRTFELLADVARRSAVRAG